ncbi:hypothetical protein ABZ953_10420 [Streptomyces sp. NPDC046465]|uniref:hypothetical protein n=1 Tax=Streptomyces sp. NPDC046465 TaxID=3155810 RepID=UPI00340B6293
MSKYKRDATARAFAAAGSPYQSARTLLLAGPDHSAAGLSALADLGLSAAARAPR